MHAQSCFGPTASPARHSGERRPELSVHAAVDDGVADAGGHAEPVGGRVEVPHSGPLGHPAVGVVYDLRGTGDRGDVDSGGCMGVQKVGYLILWVPRPVGHMGRGARVVSSLGGMPRRGSGAVACFR